jgi:hypothetical protein
MTARKITLFLSSPSDIRTERTIVVEETKRLKNMQRFSRGPRIRTVGWPDGFGAGKADYSQSAINQQSDNFDILVVIIGSRLGSPTPRANSGTEEEFDRAVESLFRGKAIQILLFFSNLRVPIDDIDPHQLMLVRAKAHRPGVLVHKYNNLSEFRRRFSSKPHKRVLQDY